MVSQLVLMIKVRLSLQEIKSEISFTPPQWYNRGSCWHISSESQTQWASRQQRVGGSLSTHTQETPCSSCAHTRVK